jgi:hypothetical protein
MFEINPSESSSPGSVQFMRNSHGLHAIDSFVIAFCSENYEFSRLTLLPWSQ